MAKSKTRAGSRSPKRVSDEIVLKEIELNMKRAEIWKIAVIGIFGAICLLASYPTTTLIAGKTTTVDISVAFTFSLAVTCAWGVTGWWGHAQRKRATRTDARNHGLERDVRELQRRLRDNHLPDDVSRLAKS